MRPAFHCSVMSPLSSPHVGTPFFGATVCEEKQASNRQNNRDDSPGWAPDPHKDPLEEEEEEEDLFVFNDTIEGPRAPAVKPGRVTQA